MVGDVAINGEDALWMTEATEYDVVVLDVELPGVDGLETIRRLRAEGRREPLLVLTARTSVDERVAGLDAGADDVLTKPFELRELFARLRALARRGPIEHPTVLQVGALRLDPAGRKVWRDGHEIALAEKPFAVLETFMRRPGVALTRATLLESAWDDAYEDRSNVVDQHVRVLRDRIDRPFGTTSIETVRGRGYRLREDGGAGGRVRTNGV